MPEACPYNNAVGTRLRRVLFEDAETFWHANTIRRHTNAGNSNGGHSMTNKQYDPHVSLS